MGEDEGKGKELAEAAAGSAKFQAEKVAGEAAEAAAGAAANAAAGAAKAKKDGEDSDKANTRPDGNIHKNGEKHFVDGMGAVGGVNDY